MYGENYERLKALKYKMDPTCFFRHAMWPHKSGHDEELDALHKATAGGAAAAKDGASADILTHGRASRMAEVNDLSNDLSFNKTQTIENVAIDAYRAMGAAKGKGVDGQDGKELGGARMTGNIPDGPDGTLVVDMDVSLAQDGGMKAKGFGRPGTEP